MRYHVLVYLVPDLKSADEEPLIDEEFDSDRPIDEALIEWAMDWDDENYSGRGR